MCHSGEVFVAVSQSDEEDNSKEIGDKGNKSWFVETGYQSQYQANCLYLKWFPLKNLLQPDEIYGVFG